MSKKLTTEDIKERIFKLVGDEYKLLSEYVNARTKIRVKHVVCDCIFEATWSNFQQGSRCPKCAGNYRYKDSEINKLVAEMTNGEYTKLSEYKNANTKFRMRHETCNFEYMVSWNKFLQGRRCPKCANLTRKNKLTFTNEDIVKAMFELVGNEYTKMDDTYINAQTKFSIRHNKCNCVYEVSWGNFQKGHRCPKCAGRYRYTDSEISELVSEMTNGEYIKLSEYKDSRTKFRIRHNKCNFEYMVCWGNFQQGQRCPRCNQSKGEKFIEDYLTNHNISFATQVRFDDCRHKLPLPFDFAILDSENEVVALIEFDGGQHYEPVKAWGGEEKLKLTQIRDRIKDSYCKEHKIPLLRIRFDDEDIEEKLNLFINQEAKRKV